MEEKEYDPQSQDSDSESISKSLKKTTSEAPLVKKILKNKGGRLTKTKNKISKKMEEEEYHPAESTSKSLKKATSALFKRKIQKNKGGRPTKTHTQTVEALLIRAQKEANTQPLYQHFIVHPSDSSSILCQKCQTTLTKPKKFQRLEKHVEYKLKRLNQKGKKKAKSSKIKEIDEKKIERMKKKMRKTSLGVKTLDFIKKMKDYKKEIQPFQEEFNAELSYSLRNGASQQEKDLAQTIYDTMKNIDKITMVDDALVEIDSKLTFVHADFFVDSTEYERYAFYIRNFYKTSSHWKNSGNLSRHWKIISCFLDNCISNKFHQINKVLIEDYIKCLKNDKDGKMKKSSLKQYTAILNRLLTPGAEKARYSEEDDGTKSLSDIKRIPFIIQFTLFRFCQNKHPEFFPSLCLLKFAIVRADELVYLQKKNLIRIHIDSKQFQRTTCWLRYLQKKTWTEKSVIIPEEVWEMFRQLKEDDYLVSFRSANGYRRKYRQIFNEFQKFHNQARYYTAHCWRHTGAIEVIMMGWKMVFLVIRPQRTPSISWAIIPKPTKKL